MQDIVILCKSDINNSVRLSEDRHGTLANIIFAMRLFILLRLSEDPHLLTEYRGTFKVYNSGNCLTNSDSSPS
jgi:hypothetical protein